MPEKAQDFNYGTPLASLPPAPNTNRYGYVGWKVRMDAAVKLAYVAATGHEPPELPPVNGSWHGSALAQFTYNPRSERTRRDDMLRAAAA